MTQQELQRIEQNIQHLLVQKQNLQGKLIEYESALEELDDESTAYRLIGNVMVKKKATDLISDLEEKKKVLDMRLESIEKQEERLRSQASSIHEKMSEDGSGNTE